jgi:hypothetical protein
MKIMSQGVYYLRLQLFAPTCSLWKLCEHSLMRRWLISFISNVPFIGYLRSDYYSISMSFAGNLRRQGYTLPSIRETMMLQNWLPRGSPCCKSSVGKTLNCHGTVEELAQF